MDPATVIVVLAAHLICTGALLHLVGRRMPPRCGVQPWAGGLALFGTAYGVRLALGSDVSPWLVMPCDLAMMLAALGFSVGLRQYADGAPVDRRRVALWVGGLAATEAVAIALHGHLGRHVVLNTGLGLIYLVLAREAVLQLRRLAPPLRPALALLLPLIAVQGVLTLARAANIALHGLPVVLGGTYAKVYYGWSTLAAVLMAMCLLWSVFLRLTSQLEELATHDALTRVLNRAGLDDALRRHYGTRPQLPLTLLAVDIDHFKRINDGHGHAAGDRVLRAVADTLVRHLRPNDLVARLGGEEFVVCSTAPERSAAIALAERLRSAVAAQAHDVGIGTLHCTVSIGVSGRCARQEDWDGALADADRALYAAKSAGRDRVVAA